LNGTHHLVVCADEVTLLGEIRNTIRRNTEALLEASRKIGLDVNTVKT